MPNQSSSTGDWIRVAAATAVVVSAVTLAVALALPTVTFDTIISEAETYSIYGGIESFWEDGNYILATIVFLFSIVFPVAKLLALSAILLRRGTHTARHTAVEWLKLLGKWSMLDVFIISVFVGAIRLGIAEATSRPGIYVFAAAIALSMISTVLVGRWLSGGRPRDLAEKPGSKPIVKKLFARLLKLQVEVGDEFDLKAVYPNL